MTGPLAGEVTPSLACCRDDGCSSAGSALCEVRSAPLCDVHRRVRDHFDHYHVFSEAHDSLRRWHDRFQYCVHCVLCARRRRSCGRLGAQHNGRVVSRPSVEASGSRTCCSARGDCICSSMIEPLSRWRGRSLGVPIRVGAGPRVVARGAEGGRRKAAHEAGRAIANLLGDLAWYALAARQGAREQGAPHMAPNTTAAGADGDGTTPPARVAGAWLWSEQAPAEVTTDGRGDHHDATPPRARRPPYAHHREERRRPQADVQGRRGRRTMPQPHARIGRRLDHADDDELNTNPPTPCHRAGGKTNFFGGGGDDDDDDDESAQSGIVFWFHSILAGMGNIFF